MQCRDFVFIHHFDIDDTREEENEVLSYAYSVLSIKHYLPTTCIYLHRIY